MKNKILNLIVLCLIVTLAACGGADNPYIAGGRGNTPGTDQGGSRPPSGIGGCLVKMKAGAKLSIKVKLSTADAAADPDVDAATGILAFPEADLPEIPFRFAGETAILDAADFPEVTLNAFGVSATAKQKSGTRAQGAYNYEDGSVVLDNTILDIINPIQVTFPAASLTTEPLEVSGSKGSLSDSGSRLDKETKKIAFVGGFQIPNGFHPALADVKYGGVAVMIKMDGEFDSVPNPEECSGSIDGPVSFREVVDSVTHPGETEEKPIPTGEFSLGAVYVPQAGVDVLNASDATMYRRYYKTKTVRVKNNQETAMSGTLSSVDGIKIEPATYNIAPGSTQDFVITFGFLPLADYSEVNVPKTKDVKLTLRFGPTDFKMLGVAKRAAPEIAVTVAEATAQEKQSGVYDFGSLPIQLIGTGPSSRMQCTTFDRVNTPSKFRVVKVSNEGVRNLAVQGLPAPVDDDTDRQTDCLRGFGGQEFIRLNLNDQPDRGARCNRETVGGREYLLDQCNIAPGSGSVAFLMGYVPKNASSILTPGSVDTGAMSIPSNDPSLTEPYKIKMKGSVFKDISDLLAAQKKSDTPVACSAPSYTRVANNGSLRIDLREGHTDSTQVFEFINGSSETLQNVTYTLNPEAAASGIELQGTLPNSIPASSSCPGKSEVAVKFTRPMGAALAYPATLTVKYTPSSTISAAAPRGVENTFVLRLTGTVGANLTAGTYRVKIDVLTAFLKTGISVGLTSLDYRIPANVPYRTGSLDLIIEDDPTTGPGGVVKTVRIKPPENTHLDPANDDFVNYLVSSTNKDDRRGLIRLLTTRNSSCHGSYTCSNDVEPPSCDDPENIRFPYRPGDCSYFYYVMGQGQGSANLGRFNTETGSLIIPNILVRSVNPYHKGDPMPANYTADHKLRATITTAKINTREILLDGQTFNALPEARANLEVTPTDFASSQGGVANFPPCPENWNPEKPLDMEHPERSPKPTLTCFFNRGSSGTGDGYVQGRSATWFVDADGHLKQSIVLGMVTRYPDRAPGAPSVVFLDSANMWAAIQGSLERVGP